MPNQSKAKKADPRKSRLILFIHFPTHFSIAPSSDSNDSSPAFLGLDRFSHLILRSLCWSSDSFAKAADWRSRDHASGCTRGFNDTCQGWSRAPVGGGLEIVDSYLCMDGYD